MMLQRRMSWLDLFMRINHRCTVLEYKVDKKLGKVCPHAIQP